MTDNTECRKAFEEWFNREYGKHPDAAEWYETGVLWIGYQAAYNTCNNDKLQATLGK